MGSARAGGSGASNIESATRTAYAAVRYGTRPHSTTGARAFKSGVQSSTSSQRQPLTPPGSVTDVHDFTGLGHSPPHVLPGCG